MTKEGCLKTMIQDYYGKLFTKDANTRQSVTINRGFPTLPSNVWANLNKKITDEEVKKALFEMAP